MRTLNATYSININGQKEQYQIKNEFTFLAIALCTRHVFDASMDLFGIEDAVNDYKASETVEIVRNLIVSEGFSLPSITIDKVIKATDLESHLDSYSVDTSTFPDTLYNYYDLVFDALVSEVIGMLTFLCMSSNLMLHTYSKGQVRDISCYFDFISSSVKELGNATVRDEIIGFHSFINRASDNNVYVNVEHYC